MYVKIIIYSDENKFSAKLISKNHSKKITGKPNKNLEIKTLLLGLIKTIKKIKYPVDLTIINENLKLKEVFVEGLEKFKHKNYIKDNLKEWKELSHLIMQHEHFVFSLPEKETDLLAMQKLRRDCVYKRF